MDPVGRRSVTGLGQIFNFLQVQGSVLVLYVYQLRTDEKGVESVGVEKVTFRKNGDAPS